MKKRIEAFKNELKNLLFYNDEIRRLEGEIELLIYDMENVRGINYSKDGGSYNPAAAEHRRLSLIEKKKRLEEKKEEVEKKQKSLGKVLKVMPASDRDLVLDVIAYGRKYREVCQERNIPNTSKLFYLINSIIEEALKKAG